MSDLPIRKEAGDTKGRYVIEHADGAMSELTYSILSKSTVIADHTGVAPAHEGQGYGKALAEALVNDARAEGFKIVPLCPYINALRRRRGDWADVFQV